MSKVHTVSDENYNPYLFPKPTHLAIYYTFLLDPYPVSVGGSARWKVGDTEDRFLFHNFWDFDKNTALLKWVRIDMEDVPGIFDETIPFRSRMNYIGGRGL